MIELKRVKFQILADSSFHITGFNHFWGKVTIKINNHNQIISCRLTTEFFEFENADKKVYRINLKDIDFSSPFVPMKIRIERCLKGFKREFPVSLSAVYDLIAESSMVAFGLSEKVDEDRLFQEYGRDLYAGVDIDAVVAMVMKAVKG